MDTLHITRLTLKNFRCFGELILDPKQVCVVQGGNGVGKSTLLEAVKATLDGGYCQEWIQTGKDEAEVILSLSNGVTVTLSLKAPNAKRSKYIRTVEITDADGSQIKAPQTYLKQLATGIAYDPARFLTSNDQERAKYIAQFLNVSLEAVELIEAAGGDWIIAHHGAAVMGEDCLTIATVRADWKRELEQPDKAEALAQFCRNWFIAAPDGIRPESQPLRPDQSCEGCSLHEARVDGDGALKLAGVA